MSQLAVSRFPTPLGEMLVGVVDRPPVPAGAHGSRDRLLATGPAVCLLEFADRPRLDREYRELEAAFGQTPVSLDHPLHDTVAERLAAYFAGDLAGCPALALPALGLPIHAPGTLFQHEVWAALTRIPLGETTSYGRLARAIGRDGAQRAVGAANGANRISIALPCHRVIESGGALRGYGGGLERKRWLLAHERAMRGETLFAPVPR